MSQVTSRLFQALHNRLSTHVSVEAELGNPPRLYDRAPADPIFPYLTYGALRHEDAGGDEASLSYHTLTLHVWSRYSGRGECFGILEALSQALESGTLSLPNGGEAKVYIQYSDILRAPDGRTFHGLIRLKFITCLEAA